MNTITQDTAQYIVNKVPWEKLPVMLEIAKIHAKTDKGIAEALTKAVYTRYEADCTRWANETMTKEECV